MKLNVGCGRNIREGWVNIDEIPQPGVDCVKDLDCRTGIELPFDDDSVDEILMSHFIEHINHPLPLMQELWRVAKPGCKCVIFVPYGSSDDAFEDPTHVRQYFLNSFGYFSQPFYWRADYGYRGDWSCEKIDLRLVPSVDRRFAWERILRERNIVAEMVATLTAVKPIRNPSKNLQDRPVLTLL